MLLTTLSATCLKAQEQFQNNRFGNVSGIVSESIDGETLIGVNLLIKGTSLGTSTDEYGEYLIRRIPEGEQILIVSYIGYESIERTINVISGENTVINFTLKPQTLEGQEVVVSSQASGQKSAINEQINSRTIKNVVSAEKIRELPDASAATAISRLPGVSLEGGDKIVLRGIKASMNAITVNGIQLPSTSMNDRATNLGFISSNMLAGIDVTKAITPDMDANAIGGTVNLRLQEAPEDLRFDFLMEGSYNTQDETADNYQIWGSVSNRFFDKKLGVFVQLNTNKSNGGGDYSQAGYTIQNVTDEILPYGEAVYAMNSFVYGDEVRITKQTGGNIILDFKLPNTKIALQNTYAATNNNYTGHLDRLLLAVGERRFDTDRDISSKQLLINALQIENDFDFVQINLSLSSAFSDKNTDLRYGQNNSFDFQNASISPFLSNFPVNERLLLTPEDIYQLEFNPTYLESDITPTRGEREYQEFSEWQKVAKLDLTFPVGISNNITGELKTGGVYKTSERNNGQDRITARIAENPTFSNSLAEEWMREKGMDPTRPPLFSNFKNYKYGDGRGSNYLGGDYNMSQVIDTDLLDQYVRLASGNWGFHKADSRRNDYSGTETISAFYGMIDFNLWNKFRILGGIRYEDLHSDYDANMTLTTHPIDGNARIPNDELDTPEVQFVADSLTTTNKNIAHWFPNIQFQYKINSNIDLRFAYTKSLSRPDYSAIVPSVYYASSESGRAGNPNLKPAVSDNFDAYLSLYNNQIGLFTIGAFYKEINNMFYSEVRLYENLDESIIYPSLSEIARINFQAPSSKASITTFFNNPYPAHLRGVEFDWQTHLWYLPKLWSNIVLSINYTRTFSSMDYAQTNYKQEEDCSGRFCIPIAVPFDTMRTARLIQQGNHLVNMSIGYDYKGFSGRVSYRMQGNVITRVANRPEQDLFSGNGHDWDLTIRQKMRFDGLSLFLNAMNIGYLPNKNYQKFKRDPEGQVLNNLTRTSYYARRFQIGLRYSF
ncbi:MAG: TonB-dependent receptor [Bacteroidetes bacterium]|nr:TonB-dependent receptor [Bacteroidota bacterium]